MGLLIPEVFIILLTDTIFTLMLLYMLPTTFSIAFGWDMTSVTEAQYKREKKRSLTSALIYFVFILKIPLFLFYIYANDKMAGVLTGAMCAAGSINATDFGNYVYYLKIIDIYLMVAWLSIYRSNNNLLTLPYTKMKYRFLLFITSMVTAETMITYMNFISIDPTAVVSCCSSIYSSTSEEGSAVLTLQPFTAFYIFIGVSACYVISILLKRPLLVFVCGTVFLFIGYLNLILFTSTYIYELPSHKCPFCILQKEYYYIGYVFFISLFITTASSLQIFVESKIKNDISSKAFTISMVAALIFIFASIYFPVKYYLTNGIWL